MRLFTKLTAGLCLLIVTPVASAAASDWQVDLAPYVWMSGIDGTVTVGGRSASFDWSFSDLVSDVDAAFMSMAAVRYKRFVVFAQYDYIQLDTNANIKTDASGNPLPAGAKVDGTIDTTIATGGVGWHFDIFKKHQLDLLLGVRRFSLDTKLTAPNNKVSADDDITDTIVILSPTFRLGEKWALKPILSYGIAGDSDTTYELQPQLHYLWSPSLTLAVGYRTLHYEEKSGQQGTPSRREFDGDLSGLMLGFGWRFQGK